MTQQKVELPVLGASAKKAVLFYNLLSHCMLDESMSQDTVATLLAYLACCQKLIVLHSFCVFACATTGGSRCRFAVAFAEPQGLVSWTRKSDSQLAFLQEAFRHCMASVRLHALP